MRKTLLFTSLDLRLIFAYLKGLLLLFAIGLVMTFSMKTSSLISSYMFVALVLVMSYPFAVEGRSKLNILYGTLPITKKNIVIGRYLSSLVLQVAGAVVTFLSTLIVSYILKENIPIFESLLTILILAAVYNIFVAFQFPLYFKLGYSKARLVANIPMFIVFIFVLQLPAMAKLFDFELSSVDSAITNMVENPFLLCAIPILISLVLLAGSCFLSYRIYLKKEV